MVSGASGQLGVPAVRPADRAPAPGPGNVIPPSLLMAEKPAPDQSQRKRLARINLVNLQVDKV